MQQYFVHTLRYLYGRLFHTTSHQWDNDKRLQTASLPYLILGSVDLLKFLLCCPTHIFAQRRHLVGMVLQRQFTIGPFHFLISSIGRYTQHLVGRFQIVVSQMEHGADICIHCAHS